MAMRFGEYELDEARMLLCRRGQRVELRPKVFDLLVYLATHRARVVRREELVEHLWETTSVGAGSLSGLVNELRKALGEPGRGPSSIRTVHARGYQFVASVEGAVSCGLEGATPPSLGLMRSGLEHLLERVAEEGAMGVVCERRSDGDESREARRSDGSDFEGALGALVACAEEADFEVHHFYSPDESMSSSAQFASQVIDRMIAARGREIVRTALPLRARVWLDEFEARSGVGAPVRFSAGPSDPLGAIAGLLSRLSRRRPMVLIVEAVERAGSRLARDLVGLRHRLAGDPVLWIATTRELEGGQACLRMLEGEGNFVRLAQAPASTAQLDRHMRRLGLEPLPGILVDAIQAHIEGRADAVDAIADWLARVLDSARRRAEPEAAQGEEEGPGEAQRRLENPRVMRTVTPWRESSSRGSGES